MTDMPDISIEDLERLIFETNEILADHEGIGGWFEKRGIDYEAMHDFYCGIMPATVKKIMLLEQQGDDGNEAMFELVCTAFLVGWMTKEQYGRGR